jgi:hypothetical protein
VLCALCSGADPGFVGREAYTVFGTLLKKKEYKITNKKLGTTLNIYLEWGKITTNYKFIALTGTTNITRSRKITLYFYYSNKSPTRCNNFSSLLS